MSPPRMSALAPAKSRPAIRYQDWSLEELRGLALQLQLSNAKLKSRQELLDLLGGAPRSEGFQTLESHRRLGNSAWR